MPFSNKLNFKQNIKVFFFKKNIFFKKNMKRFYSKEYCYFKSGFSYLSLINYFKQNSNVLNIIYTVHRLETKITLNNFFLHI